MSSKSAPEPSATDLELYERVEKSTPGTFKLFSAQDTGVEQRIQQHLSNLDEIQRRIRESVTAGCQIEAISIRLQVIDYWLRLYFANRSISTVKRRREFGGLLDQCRNLGLEATLCERLQQANLKRIDAIHGFVVGSIAYAELESVSAQFGQLVKDVVTFVVMNSGTEVTSREQLIASPGACVLHVDGFCQEVASGVRY